MMRSTVIASIVSGVTICARPLDTANLQSRLTPDNRRHDLPTAWPQFLTFFCNVSIFASIARAMAVRMATAESVPMTKNRMSRSMAHLQVIVPPVIPPIVEPL
jgi:hypothetical protein